MRVLWRKQKQNAFTLVEMLVVIAIIAVVAMLLLPALVRGKQRAQRIACINNLNEMGTAFHVFAHDHRSRFPMETPMAEGGSMEYVQAGLNIYGTFYFSYRHLQTLGNELVTPRALICPADLSRETAPTFSSLQNSNVSYFVAVYADYNTPSSVLAGDRNITNYAATASLVRGAYGLHWTSEIHRFKGNVLFSDAHVEQLNNADMGLPQSTQAAAVLFLPAIHEPGNGSSPSSPTTGSSPGAPTLTPTPTQTPGDEPPVAQTGATPGSQGANPNSPPPQTAPPAGMPGSTMGSTRRPHQNGSESTEILQTSAKETNGAAVVSGTPTTTAPAAEDDEQPPLLLLLGAVKAFVAKSSWWLLLLLAVLIGGAVYYYSRRKRHERRRL